MEITALVDIKARAIDSTNIRTGGSVVIAVNVTVLPTSCCRYLCHSHIHQVSRGDNLVTITREVLQYFVSSTVKLYAITVVTLASRS